MYGLFPNQMMGSQLQQFNIGLQQQQLQNDLWNMGFDRVQGQDVRDMYAWMTETSPSVEVNCSGPFCKSKVIAYPNIPAYCCDECRMWYQWLVEKKDPWAE